jgi:L-Ala-D/L-Glu epimerase
MKHTGAAKDRCRWWPPLWKMPLKLSYCRYRLLFKHPFGTAHGLRDGTDTVFIRAEQDGFVGYGEATLPPYLKETTDSVIQRLSAFAVPPCENVADLLERLQGRPGELTGNPAARAALHTAMIDLASKRNNVSVYQGIDRFQLKRSVTLMTVGSGDVNAIPAKIKDTLLAEVIKVKLGALDDELALKKVKSLDNRRLFLDANQGLSTVKEALERIAWAGEDLVIGIEQPFGKDRTDLHAQLLTETTIPVYGDESIQDVADLETKAGSFSGVNIKLMKCGGMDRVKELIDRANGLGIKVMLGSMSESSLGCTVMAHYADLADVVDLDGPWLILNDPFQGMTMLNGEVVLPNGPGYGINLKAELDWTYFGA